MAVNLLLSYAFHSKVDLRAVRDKMPCGRIMIDSGAFTAHTTGRTISLNEYAEFLERWSGCWDHAVTLDKIGNPEITHAHTKKLHARGLPVMPVFTKGGTLPEFDAMIRDVGYVCAGGLVGAPTAVQRKRITMLQRRAQDAGGGIHALGVGSLDTLRAARPYSADASSVSGAFRFGTIVYFDGRRVCNTPVGDRAKIKRDWQHIRAHGIELGDLVRSGRMPDRADGRGKLMQAMSVAYAVADEYLKRLGPVPPPRQHNGVGTHLYNSVVGQADGYDVGYAANLDRQLHAGPHLYNSVAPEFGVQPAASVDTQLHGQQHTPPPIWARYAQHHTCNRTADTHV